MFNSLKSFKRSGTFKRSVAKERNAIIQRAREYAEEIKASRPLLKKLPSLPAVVIEDNINNHQELLASAKEFNNAVQLLINPQELSGSAENKNNAGWFLG